MILLFMIRIIIFSILSAADIANVNKEILNTLDCFSEHLGLMFQIKDDLLDVYGDEKKLGKKVGSDVAVSYTHLTLPTSDLV